MRGVRNIRSGLGACSLLVSICLTFSIASGAWGQDEMTSPPPGMDVIRMAYSAKQFKGLDLNDVQVAVELWTKQLLARLEESVGVDVLFFQDVSELVSAVEDGELDMIALSTLEYLEIRDRVPVEPLLMGIVEESVFDEYILLVRRDRDLHRLEQLSGMSLMVETGPRAGPVPEMWLESLLLEAGLGPKERFFGTIDEADKVSRAVLAVFFGPADACLVRMQMFETMVELNPQLSEELSILANSPPLLAGVMCFPKNFDLEKRRFLIENALDLYKHPPGQQLLTLFRVSGLVRFQPSCLGGIDALAKEYNRLKVVSGGTN